ncbi:hypothetical protein Dda_6324 [Drechslerella dactyloides]|uniref:Tyrosinase copper-binding domain-containing protein n=1 Tax=Drechslerella dactyloides TaxID=74499 RepID=A0AAD6IZU4_DREDA|nr:hypothetical protein Dda_6324 [Drechslerella dactyloides]
MHRMMQSDVTTLYSKTDIGLRLQPYGQFGLYHRPVLISGLMAPKLPNIPTSADFTGYSILIIGATAGIGLENARQYLQLGVSTLYLGVRNVEKGEQVKRVLLDDPIVKLKNPHAVVQIYEVDLASLASVASFSRKFPEEVKTLNIAVLNAGVALLNYVQTIDGMETTFQVNYLSNAWIATSLVPLLTSSAAASGKLSHLAFVSSMMQNVGGFGTRKTVPQEENIIDWFSSQNNHGLDRYNVTKLLLTAYANELASRINADQVVVNSMCPGLVQTDLDNNMPFFIKYPMKVLRSFAGRSPSEGARALTLATLTGRDGNGKFYSDGHVTPYWDWSDPNTQSYLPTAVTVDTVTVVEPGPDGNPITTNIPNPLNAYTFQSRNSTSTFWGNFATWPTTLRQPDASGASRNDLANATLQNTYSNRHQATYLAFSYTSFNDFSVSLEALHDEVHSSIGGVGHMTYIPYSSYDPVFWLHHSNMDRLMAMYQAAKADTFIQPLSSVATFANLNSQLDTVETPLYPFRRFDGSFWTSQDVSSASTIFPLSYGYPEVPCLMTFTTFDALRNHTTTEVNRLYAPKPASPTKRSVDTNAIRKEWQAKVTIDQSELRGTFVVYFFFGKPPAHSSLWPTSASMIGSFARLGSPGVQMQPEVVGSNVILTDALHKALTVSSPQDQILSFLKHNLTWMVLSDNEPVDIRSLKTGAEILIILKLLQENQEVRLPTAI